MDWPALVEALSKVAWPILAAILLLLLVKPVRSAIQARGFKVKVGELEISVQDATEQLRQQLEDLQKQVAAISQTTGAAPAHGVANAVKVKPAATAIPARILWVDDEPANNALLIARLRDRGVAVDLAEATAEAMRALSAGRYVAVISDIGRKEGLLFNSDAGIDLLRQMRAEKIDIPVLFYTSSKSVQRWRSDAQALGAAATTSSPIELLLALERLGIDAA